MLTLLNPWSCTPDVSEVLGHPLHGLLRPYFRNASSYVASYCSTAEPYRNPCVHSVQPRAVYFPFTV